MPVVNFPLKPIADVLKPLAKFYEPFLKALPKALFSNKSINQFYFKCVIMGIYVALFMGFFLKISTAGIPIINYLNLIGFYLIVFGSISSVMYLTVYIPFSNYQHLYFKK